MALDCIQGLAQVSVTEMSDTGTPSLSPSMLVDTYKHLSELYERFSWDGFQ